MATVVAVPSHSEGSPNVVLEAMAAGLPIAASRVGGVPEILEEGVTGLMVEPRNPEADGEDDIPVVIECGFASRVWEEPHEARAESAHTPEAYRRALVEFYQETLRSLRK